MSATVNNLHPIGETKKDPRVELLEYLLGVATKTEGAEVWRALFAEMRRNVITEAQAKREY